MAKISEQLEKARTWCDDNKAYIQGGDKAAFHVCSPVGWINDPNGFSEYGGKTHLFFQHHPYDAQWGPMHWGHVVTDDFVRWELLPEALAPDGSYENGCFSGSAVTYKGQHALVYTSNLDILLPSGTHKVTQQQSLALGDGVDYEKVPENPVVRNELLPDDCYAPDTRDPHVWEEDGVYKMIVASRRASDKRGQYLLYESTDLRSWRYVNTIAHSTKTLGKMWECPDYFALDGKQVLLISAQEMQPTHEGFHGKNGTAVMVGTRDKAAETFTPETLRPIDYGWDFYAPQTLLTPDGRRVMIAWMQSWDNNVTPPEQVWTGMMTFPRELQVRDGMLYQNPVREIANYYANRRVLNSVTGVKSRQLAFGRQLDFTLTVKDAETAVFTLDVAAREHHLTRLTYNAPARKLTIDRRHAGMVGDNYQVQVVPLTSVKSELKLRALMDKYSLELFLNDGEQAITVLLFTEPECQDVVISAPRPVQYSFECYEIDMDREASE